LNDSPVLFDANVWIAMSFASHVHHRSATELFQKTTREHPAVFCRATQQAFLRIASNPTFLRLAHAPPLTNGDALAALKQIMSLPSVTFRDEPPGLEMIWFKLGVFSFLPRWAIEIALAVHFYEAVLATLAIVVWHFYHVIFDPDVYPVNFAFLDGRVSEEHYREEHELAYEESLKETPETQETGRTAEAEGSPEPQEAQ